MFWKLEVRTEVEKAQQRLDILTKPKESLGVLEDMVVKLAGITGNQVSFGDSYTSPLLTFTKKSIILIIE